MLQEVSVCVAEDEVAGNYTFRKLQELLRVVLYQEDRKYGSRQRRTRL